MAFPFAIMGDGSNAGTVQTGISLTGLGQLHEQIIGGFIQDVWLQDTLTDRVFTQGIPEFKNGGWEAKFRRRIRATVADYVIGKELDYSGGLEGWTDYTIALDRACWGHYGMNDLEAALLNRDVVTSQQLMGDMGKSLADEIGQKHWTSAMSWLLAKLVATNAMATPEARVGLFYKGSGTADVATGKWEAGAGTVNVMDVFRKARIARTRNNVPKQMKIMALVAPEVMDVLLHMEKVHFSVGNTSDQDKIMRGDFGEMIVSGFEVIQTPWITKATYNTQADNYPVLFVTKEAVAFHRVLDKSDTIQLEKDFGKVFRQLSAFGMGMMDERLCGIGFHKLT